MKAQNRHPWRLAAPMALLAALGCGDGTGVKLADVPPVAPAPEAKKPTPPKANVPRSPDVLPGSNP